MLELSNAQTIERSNLLPKQGLGHVEVASVFHVALTGGAKFAGVGTVYKIGAFEQRMELVNIGVIGQIVPQGIRRSVDGSFNANVHDGLILKRSYA